MRLKLRATSAMTAMATALGRLQPHILLVDGLQVGDPL